jgi:hypothetical protein
MNMIKDNIKTILVVCSLVYAGAVWVYKINQHEPRITACELEISQIKQDAVTHNTAASIELAKINATLQEVRLGVAQINKGLIDLGLSRK